jgi:hypothetical protein
MLPEHYIMCDFNIEQLCSSTFYKRWTNIAGFHGISLISVKLTFIRKEAYSVNSTQLKHFVTHVAFSKVENLSNFKPLVFLCYYKKTTSCLYLKNMFVDTWY